MLVAVRSKAAFRETSRYILFAHMLFNHILHLVTSMVLYVCSILSVNIIQTFCTFLMLISTTTFINEPLNLAVMSLERYVAVCFPLRHGELSTPERTFFTLAAIWAVVAGVLLFTYMSITREARSASTDRASVQKAMRTVMLHAFQLCLSLMSFLFNWFEILMVQLPLDVFVQLRFVTYVVVLLLPRCLSPLIYGLRDQSFRPVFMYHFTCGTRSVKPAGPSGLVAE
ncbi:olfactory receptor 11A1-like [Arapaima gigas]